MNDAWTNRECGESSVTETRGKRAFKEGGKMHLSNKYFLLNFQ